MALSKEHLLQQCFGFLIFLLGSTVVVGWLIHAPMLVTFFPGSLPMVFNTGLSFVITGFALSFPSAPNSWRQIVRTIAGIALVALCSITFIEHLVDINFGIDLASLHAWLQYGNVRPGRMAPNTALGFVVIGLALLLLDHVNTRGRAIGLLFLTCVLLAIGLTGLAGYALGPDLLFGWAVSARMALHTASGMLLATIAIGFSWQQSDWYRSQTLLDEEQKSLFRALRC